MQKKDNTIRLKVVSWFLLAALAVLLTGIISYTSYRELLYSLESTSTQDNKLKELGEILVNITEAEAKMRAYALTRDSDLLDSYQQLVISINRQLEAIKTIKPITQKFNTKVDSVTHLLNQQTTGIAGFIELKNTLNQISFSSKALEEISSSTDSIPTLRTTTSTTTTTTTVEPIASAEDEKQLKNSKRQQKKRAQEIAREIVKLEKEPKIQTETTVTTDTSFVQPDTILGNIQQILVDASLKESQYQEVLANKELQLIESSIAIIDQISGLTTGLEKQQLAENIQRANEAKVIASRSTLTISIIIFICLILGILFTYLIIRDIRTGDYYNLQLIGAKNEAEQLAESKQHFLASMSHEIRTPLNAIIGFTEQLSSTSLKPQQQQYLTAVQTSSKHLLDTVNDILDYSKIEAGELKINLENFDLKSTLEEVVKTLQIKALEKGLDLELEMNPDSPVNLIGDPFRLKQILFNLISNGIKFTDSGYVKVGCEFLILDGEASVKLAVLDSGIGIPHDKHKLIFDDFKQVDATTTRRYDGTGLGLAICKKLVELHDGKISVKPNGQRGSVFVVNLTYPVSEHMSPLDETIDAKTTTPTLLDGLKVLVADDDPFNIQLIKTILEKWNVQITCCTNGKDAMELIEKTHYQLILTDIHMPEAGGEELSRFVRSMKDPEKQRTPIIALTANVIESDLKKYKKAGIDEFVLKPYKESQLYQKIVELVPEALAGVEQPVDFRLEDFKKFSAGDNEALRPMLEAFYQNLKQNMESLENFARDEDRSSVAEIAHKMISSFGHVHAAEPVNQLRQLEIKIRSNQPDLPLQKMVAKVRQLSIPILEGLEKELKAL